MVSRFFQLVLLAGVILLIPSFLYLSHPATPTLIDPATGLAYSADSILHGQISNDHAQVSQGKGVEQSHLWNGWNWQDASANVNKGVHQVEDRVKGLIDHWRPTGSPNPPPLDPKVKPPSPHPSSPPTSTTKPERLPGVIMPKMANATAKAALGRSTWHFLHTMTLRFPDQPTPEESETLRSFFTNFAQLYPCGECARHFQQLIKDLPPQVGSRMGASLWLCAVHNEVNKSLGKEEFPCDKLDESYDCGCGDDKGQEKKGEVGKMDPKKEVTPFA
ncbi:related to ERV2-Flavin dependent sulfhydryl oxidase [Sporisorium scitamineum]|uniref:Sulfhydryl oxidase n=1 Tax=Sporisorium scitamineum TaxID=49012 RepID=A0A0F7SDG9_9BASI|nr:related to ERV2-Flavin dependent sulfhydryl oxidase [Sporisorium scitamineum]CDW99530.1 hypothetical protein [Sporisorium scitamineum]